ncbi:hypothetical protein MJ904_24010 [Massilia sp. MB5]|uniref:hypothetical protein n=1 Tax=Massilia sp. MB5 TaxID=2919578 RepID=UPI001F0D0739|nr:hypothetical protein [Massilia sp. MB5]UMR30045.1 hypothetical protein MJ904_24010 [Massilia sp. MB5]
MKGAIPWWPSIFFGFCAFFMLLEQFGWKPYRNRLEISSSGIRRTFGPALRAKKVEEVAWSDVSKIEVETTDAGPAVDDMFFWIHGASGKGVVVSSEIAGKHGLVKELQARFPGLDNHALAEASGCCSNRHFLLWEKLAS